MNPTGNAWRIGAGLLLMGVFCAPCAGEPAHAECIVPAKAGGGFDLTCKAAQMLLSESKAIRLSYLPGGIGAVAYTTMVTKRPADDAAIVAFSSGSLLNLAQGKFGPYTEADVRWLAVVGMDYGVIAVRKDSPFRSLKDLLDALKAAPRNVTFGAGGTLGSQDWFKAALLARAVGVSHRSLRFVAFEGGGDALTALEGGHVGAFTGDAAEVSRHMAMGGSVRVLAVLSEQRLPREFADVPTARESGVDLVWPIARGFYMGPKVSEPAYREWSDLLRRALSNPSVQTRLSANSLYPANLTGEEMHAFIERHMAQYRRLASQFELPRR
jgi:putative tricarboxylic transport membrane protein